MEIVFLDKTDPTPIYSFEMKQDWNDQIRYEVPAKLIAARAGPAGEGRPRVPSPRSAAATWPGSTSAWTPRGASSSSSATRCPGLAPGWSDLVLIAQAAGIDYRGLIGEILSFAIRRYQERSGSASGSGAAPSCAAAAGNGVLAPGGRSSEA